MTNEDGSLWIVFNGEIYNYRQLRRALETAGHPERAALLAAAPGAFAADDKLHVAEAGAPRDWARALVARTRRKSGLPEALRLAHMIARALETGESRGRP